MKKSTISKFVEKSNKCIEQWEHLFTLKKFILSTKVCSDFIRKSRKQYKFYKRKSEKDAHVACCFLILIKGLEELSSIYEILCEQNWHKSESNFEAIWDLRCNCKDRLNFVCSHIKNSQRIEAIISKLDEIDNIVNAFFENIFYVSPGIIADKFVCSICREDFRICCHICGYYYDGKLCRYEPINPRIEHVALVKIPKDERCRVWPWNNQENGTIKLTILVAFQVDNFLED